MLIATFYDLFAVRVHIGRRMCRTYIMRLCVIVKLLVFNRLGAASTASETARPFVDN